MNNTTKDNKKEVVFGRYEATLADPEKLAKLVRDNVKQIESLEKARFRVLGLEINEKSKIKKTPTGAVWDEQEKGVVANEIRKFDPKLASQIAGEKNKKKIVGAIDSRIKQIKKDNTKFEKGLGSLKEKQRITLAKGGYIVRKILKDITEVKGLYETEARILKQNERIRDEIKKRIANGVGIEGIDDFVALAKKLEENNKKDVEIKKTVVELRKKLEDLKKKATPIEMEFIQETEEIQRRKKAA